MLMLDENFVQNPAIREQKTQFLYGRQHKSMNYGELEK